MSDYNVISNLPYGFDFRNQNRKEIAAYKTWFVENESIRLAELKNRVRQSNYSNINLDVSPNSLIGLGDFMAETIKKETLSKSQFEELRNRIPEYINIDSWDLTLESRSLLIDIGVYWGNVLIKNHPHLAWSQYISRNKKDVNFGHMVIQINKDSYVNPIWLMYIQGLKVAKGTFERTSLYNLYIWWSERIR